MFYLKGCPKCHGDVYKRTDIYGPYTSCMQCSHYLNEAEEAQLKPLATRLALKPVKLAQEEKVAA